MTVEMISAIIVTLLGGIVTLSVTYMSNKLQMNKLKLELDRKSEDAQKAFEDGSIERKAKSDNLMSDTLTTVTEALRKEIVIMREDDERKSAQFKRRIDELTEEQRLTNEKLTTTIIELNKSNRRSEEQAAQIDEQTKQIAALTSAVAESSHGIDLLVAQIEALNLVPAYKKNSR